MPYRIAGIDIEKRMLTVVVSDVPRDGEYEFEGRRWAAVPRNGARWPMGSWNKQVEEVVRESTAQYWKPVGEPWNDTSGAGPCESSPAWV
jgi:hypothetical protein